MKCDFCNEEKPILYIKLIDKELSGFFCEYCKEIIEDNELTECEKREIKQNIREKDYPLNERINERV